MIRRIGYLIMLNPDYNPKSFVSKLHKQDQKVMLDVKMYDIPSTMKATMESAKKIGADYISILDYKYKNRKWIKKIKIVKL